MKIVNGGLVLNDLRRVDCEERDGQTIEITRTLSGRVMSEHIRISGPRGSGDYRREQRLYVLKELERNLSSGGLAVTSLSGTLEGGPFDPATSDRMWIVSVRH